MKSRFFYCLLLLIFTSLTSCNKSEIDISKRPSDYKMDFWLNERIKSNELNDSLVYGYKSDSIYTYLDSHYSFKIKDKVKKLPDYYVTYNVCLEEEIATIQAIFITDPKISIYGLSLKSSSYQINRTLSNMGFEYFDQYSGWYPSYLKKEYSFTFTVKRIILSVLKS